MSQPAMSRTFAALHFEAFRWLWLGTLFSFLGNQVQVLARAYLGYQLTGKNGALGGVLLAFGLPQLLLSPWGGVIADRFPKRRILLATQALIVLNSAGLTAMLALDRLDYWTLIGFTVIHSSVFAVGGPVRTAFTTSLVDAKTVGNAVILQQLSIGSTRVIGPSLAGVMIGIAFIGITGVMVGVTLAYLMVMVFVIRLPAGDPKPGARKQSPVADLTAGFRYVQSRPAVRHLVLMSMMVIMLGFAYQNFVVPLAQTEYGVGPAAMGWLSSAAAVGAVAATLVVATYSEHRFLRNGNSLSAFALGGATIALGLAPSYVPGLIAMVFIGGLASAFQSFNNSRTMMLTAPEFQGRVQSINFTAWSLYAIAALPIGLLADAIGLRETLVLMGVLVVISVGVLELFSRAQRLDFRDVPVVVEVAPATPKG